MKELIDVLFLLWPRKYWILGITAAAVLIGLVFKIPSVVKDKYQAKIEFQIVNIPNETKMDFNSLALQFEKDKTFLEALSKEFQLGSSKIKVKLGKNKNICFYVTNSDQKLAEEIVKEWVEIYHQKIFHIVNNTITININKLDNLILIYQQQIDSIKQDLITMFEQKGGQHNSNTYLSNFDNRFYNNTVATAKPKLTSVTEADEAARFVIETSLFNSIYYLHQLIDKRNKLVSALVYPDYIFIIEASSKTTTIQTKKLLIGAFVLGLLISVLLFLFLDAVIPKFKSFINHYSNTNSRYDEP